MPSAGSTGDATTESFLKSQVLIEQVPTAVAETTVVKQAQAAELRSLVSEWSAGAGERIFSAADGVLAEALISPSVRIEHDDRVDKHVDNAAHFTRHVHLVELARGGVARNTCVMCGTTTLSSPRFGT